MEHEKTTPTRPGQSTAKIKKEGSEGKRKRGRAGKRGSYDHHGRATTYVSRPIIASPINRAVHAMKGGSPDKHKTPMPRLHRAAKRGWRHLPCLPVARPDSAHHPPNRSPTLEKGNQPHPTQTHDERPAGFQVECGLSGQRVRTSGLPSNYSNHTFTVCNNTLL